MSDTNVKTAVVTGGSRGIGRSAALALAEEGYQVYLTYVSRPEAAETVCAQIEQKGGKARAFMLDVGDPEQIKAFFNDHVKDKVYLSVLVNNAGITKDGFLIRMKDSDFDQVIRINLTGSFICLREAAKIMMKQRYGRIINLTSVAGCMGNAGQANYSSAKAGVIGLTKSAARELASRGITVNAVAPGFISTEMTDVLSKEIQDKYLQDIPAGRFGTPEDVARAVCFLASEETGYVTGQILGVNGGLYT